MKFLPQNSPSLVSLPAMVSTLKQLHPSSSSAKPPKIPPPTIDDAKPTSTSTTTTSHSQQNVALSRATHLTRPELLKRRFQHLNQLSKCYRDLYWALMEDLKTQFREYYWEYGISPFKQGINVGNASEENREGRNIEGSGENNNINSCNVRTDLDVVNNQRCAFVGCKLKAMPLTSFCHLHILSDSRQKLYMPCNYVIKSAQAGPITCGKPILRSKVPSLCTVHFQKAEKHLTRALKKTGLNISSTSKMATNLHVSVTEYVHHIQVKRGKDLRPNKSKIVVKEEEKDS